MGLELPHLHPSILTSLIQKSSIPLGFVPLAPFCKKIPSYLSPESPHGRRRMPLPCGSGFTPDIPASQFKINSSA